MHRTPDGSGNILAPFRKIVALASAACWVASGAAACDRESPARSSAGDGLGVTAGGPGASTATADAGAGPASERAAGAEASAVARGGARPAPPDGVPDPPTAPDRRDGGGSSPQRVLDGYGLPLAAPLVHLCGRRALLQGGEHLVWDAFATELEPAAAADAFRARLGERGLSREGDSTIWRLPAGAPSPARVLEVLPLGAAGRHEACGAAPSTARALVVASRR